VSAPHRSTPEHWAAVEAYAQDDQVSSTDDCLLELRARVQTLEERCEVQLMQLSDLQERHHRLTLQVGQLEYELVRDDDDEPQQHCLEAMDPPDEAAEILDYYAALSAQHQDRAVFHGNSSSLVERVHSCIVGEPECGHMQARATIREVAAAARAQDQAAPEMVLTWAGVAEWLEQEAGPTFSDHP
jgi:hypothetical protein